MFASAAAITSSSLRRPVMGTATRRFLSSNQRPFQILGVQQVAIGCPDKGSLDALWKNVFGLQPKASKTLEAENVQEDILQLGMEPFQVEVDLMVPLDINKSPKVHIPPLNHIGLWVDHLEEAVKYMSEQGVRFTPGGIRPGAAGHNITFIHPKGNDQYPISGNGVLIELVQAPKEVIDAFEEQQQGKK
eukprot:scaffold133_cov115-Cylindrotheca_fusiformis.AAC.3